MSDDEDKSARHGRRDGVRQRHGRACSGKASCRCPWTFQVELGRAEDGQRRQVTKGGFATAREAKEARAKVLRDDRAGLLAADRRMTTKDFLEEWWTWRTERHETPLRPSTRLSYRLYLDRLIPLIGGIRLSELRAHHVEKAFQKLKEQYPDQSSATRQRCYATLRSAMRYAVRSKRLAVSPCDQVDLGFRRSTPKPTVWEPDQVGDFLDHLDGLPPDSTGRRLAPIFRLAVFSGLRRGEVLGLRWIDVDLERRFLTVVQQAAVIGHRIDYAVPKSSAGEQRVVALDAETVAVLKAWKAQQAADRLAWGQGWTDTGLVFTRDDGTGWHPETVTKTLPKLARAAGLPPIRFHDLRHLAAALQIAAGVDIAVVSKRMGHSTIGVTSDIYGHLLGEANRNAADAAAALVLRKGRSTGS
jgi:integrase